MESNTVTKEEANSVSYLWNINNCEFSNCFDTIFTLACGEHKLKEKIKNTKNDPVTKTKGPSCTSVVISDRFVVTSASCLAG